MKYKILYAEDEPFLARIITDNLKAKGYEVLNAEDGRMALELFKTSNPDLCILDIMMPLKDGYTLAEDIRKLNAGVPLIFVSAKSQDDDVVKGFKSGGNDYLRKPFSVVELMVRIEALLSRFNNMAKVAEHQNVYDFSSCNLDTVNQQLITPTSKYDLSFKEMALLELLLLNKNDILERQKALVKIWGDDTVYNANSMNVFMAHLRKMLNDDPGVQIISIRGIGYKLTC